VLKLLEKKYREALQSTPSIVTSNLDPSHTLMTTYVIPNGKDAAANKNAVSNGKSSPTASKDNSTAAGNNNNQSRPSTSSVMMERHQQQIQSNRANNNNSWQYQNNLHTYAPSTPSSYNAMQSSDTFETGKQQSYGGGFFYKSKTGGTNANSTAAAGSSTQQLGSNLTQRLLTNLNMYTPLMNSTSNYNQAITLANKQNIRKNLSYLSSANKAKYLQVSKPISPLCRTLSSSMTMRKEMSSLSEINNLLVAPPTPQSGIFKY
jgi:hypothetical protein